MLCKIYKFLCDRQYQIPYTNLTNDAKRSIQSDSKSDSSDSSLPSPFREIKMLKEPRDGKLVSLGLISVGMALTGLAVLVDPNANEEAPRKKEQPMDKDQPDSAKTC
uniref:Deltameth_res domain-containing protein n=1 Tax=Caenorhabditis tropicalis TaxID=1561998 RepID=A0A1I7T5U0_9PELO